MTRKFSQPPHHSISSIIFKNINDLYVIDMTNGDFLPNLYNIFYIEILTNILSEITHPYD